MAIILKLTGQMSTLQIWDAASAEVLLLFVCEVQDPDLDAAFPSAF